MLLAIDVGNTQTVIGLYSAVEPTARSADADLVDHWRISTSQERSADEYALVLKEFLGFHDLGFAEAQVDGVVVSSVVPRVTGALRGFVERYLDSELVVLEPGVRTGMPIRYDNPKEVGADRIANAVGAHHLFGGPAIVVDFGTATTFDAISAKGEYLGGAIVPGIAISLEALFDRAAGLRRVELAEPRHVIGRSTAEAIQIGALHGFAAQVDGICTRFRRELGHATVVATGGLASLIVPHTTTVDHEEPWLTLHGLRLVFGRNR